MMFLSEVSQASNELAQQAVLFLSVLAVIGLTYHFAHCLSAVPDPLLSFGKLGFG